MVCLRRHHLTGQLSFGVHLPSLIQDSSIMLKIMKGLAILTLPVPNICLLLIRYERPIMQLAPFCDKDVIGCLLLSISVMKCPLTLK